MRVNDAVWVTDSPALVSPGEKMLGEGELSGLRLAVKDLFDIKGAVTGFGNPDWAATHEPAECTATAVQKLLAAGATYVGKTQTDELAYSLNGANVHYGTPVNPVAPDRLPGGSSSGSAVAVASGEADIGLGTDTGGSIRVPASYCGLYGLRPSWGVIDISAVQELAFHFDTVGLLTRDAEILARAADVLLPKQPVTEFSEVCVLEPEGVDFRANMIESHLSSLGLKATSQILSADIMGRASEAFRVLQGRDIWRRHGDWITRVRPNIASDIQSRLDWCATLTQEDENKAIQARKRIVEWLNELSHHSKRLICLPSTPGASPMLTLTGEPLAAYRTRLMGMTALAGLWSAPVVALPWFEQEGAPWGISLIASPHNDRSLMALICNG
ncbi:2-amino-5-chloromuconic acid deaminase [Halomonadaceae bacterium LMG 33818]|uniref:amidase n=1 Tax=Cernens ardua TaxID=3402176 RepID=UPI003EDC8409